MNFSIKVEICVPFGSPLCMQIIYCTCYSIRSIDFFFPYHFHFVFSFGSFQYGTVHRAYFLFPPYDFLLEGAVEFIKYDADAIVSPHVINHASHSNYIGMSHFLQARNLIPYISNTHRHFFRCQRPFQLFEGVSFALGLRFSVVGVEFSKTWMLGKVSFLRVRFHDSFVVEGSVFIFIVRIQMKVFDFFYMTESTTSKNST
mmetsp:Transcript_21203/g.48141  ORF Transcript_21203/g.48141 Transcript_21203/m.48141 type:complete len:201 (-) Transcript_21203:521-1123(-)